MSSIFNLIRRLFSKRKPVARAPAMSFGGPEPIADAPIEAPSPAEPETSAEPSAPILARASDTVVDEGDAGRGELDQEEGEKEGDDEEADDLPSDEIDDDDPLIPDPFVSPDAPQIEALSPDVIGRQRAAALVEALSGEHRVFLAEPAGPGTLAEALNRLAQEGKVAAEFHDDPDEGPYLLYRLRPNAPGKQPEIAP
jgi:hypothetical protein